MAKFSYFFTFSYKMDQFVHHKGSKKTINILILSIWVIEVIMRGMGGSHKPGLCLLICLLAISQPELSLNSTM